MSGVISPFSLMTSSRVAEVLVTEREKSGTVFLCNVGTGVYNVIRFAALRFCTLGLCRGVVFVVDSKTFEIRTHLRCSVLNR